MCYRTPEGTEGQAKSGIWASGEAGLLWFFNRGNAEVLVKVLNGCRVNDHRWVFVAPVTDLEFNLWVTANDGRRWTHSNRQGVTAATKSDTSAFRCTDNDDALGSDLVVESVSASDTRLSTGERFTLRATVRNQGDAWSTSTTLRYYRSTDSSVSNSDTQVGTDSVSGLAVSGASAESISVTAPSTAGTWYYGTCVDPVSGESNKSNNCSNGVRVTVSGNDPDPNSLAGTWTGWVTNPQETPNRGTMTITIAQNGQSISGTFRVCYDIGCSAGFFNGAVHGSSVTYTAHNANPLLCSNVGAATLVGSRLSGTWSAIDCTASAGGSFSLTRTN